MNKKNTNIPINKLKDKFDVGIVVENILSFSIKKTNEAEQSHRHNFHFFLLLQTGEFQIEIDFELYKIKAPAVLYIHPSQVHRILKADKTNISFLGLSSENLNPDYLKTLEQFIYPTKPLLLESEVFDTLNQTMTLATTIFKRKKDKLYASILKDYCNAFIGIIVSQYLNKTTTSDNSTRFHIITKEFKLLLERNFILMKRPSNYANALNISTPYLNQCVRKTTGFSVSHHIQQRIILEAKRQLYHSKKSVKEIAFELGYEDYPYFSRLFTKITGMTALEFRNKNFD